MSGWCRLFPVVSGPRAESVLTLATPIGLIRARPRHPLVRASGGTSTVNRRSTRGPSEVHGSLLAFARCGGIPAEGVADLELIAAHARVVDFQWPTGRAAGQANDAQ